MPATVALETELSAALTRIQTLEQTVQQLQQVINSGGGGGNGGARSYVMAADFGVSAANPDNRAALQAAIDAAWASRLCSVRLPAEMIRISDSVDISGVALEGPATFSDCALVLTQSDRDMVSLKGHRAGVHAPGGALRDVNLYLPPGINGRVAIIGGNGDHPTMLPDLFEIEGVRITVANLPGYSGALGTFQHAMHFNGTTRATPPGIRGGYVKDVEFFNVRGAGLVFFGVTNLRVSNVRGFTGGGVQALTGGWFGGNATVKCDDVQVSDCRWDGPVNVTNTQFSGFEGRFYGGTQYDGSAVACVFSTD